MDQFYLRRDRRPCSTICIEYEGAAERPANSHASASANLEALPRVFAFLILASFSARTIKSTLDERKSHSAFHSGCRPATALIISGSGCLLSFLENSKTFRHTGRSLSDLSRIRACCSGGAEVFGPGLPLRFRRSELTS